MTKLFVDKTIEIHAPASKVWRVFTDPDLTRQMGGEYVSDWKVGSSFGFKGLDGKMLTNGTILKIEPEKLLQHKLFNSISSIDSVITYELQEHNGDTTLYSREEFTSPVSDKEYADIVEGWNAALLAVKELAENI
jgi:uncharacterized protein YndB with AHSA1/START domain